MKKDYSTYTSFGVLLFLLTTSPLLKAQLSFWDLQDKPIYQSVEEGLQQPNEVFRLDLSYKSLSFLPYNLEKFTELQEINLSYNPKLNLFHVVDVLAKFPKLEILNVSYNNIQQIPDNITILKNLKELNIVGNNVRHEDDIKNLMQLKNLSHLAWDDNGLKRVPANIGDLVQLRTLSLANNQIPSLPTEIGRLTNLHSLNLANNPLKSLPTEMEGLAQLRFLALDLRNQALNSDDIFEILSRLPIEDLEIHHFNGAKLSQEITFWKKLVTIGLKESSGLDVEAAVKQFAALPHLEALDLSGLNIKTIPADI
ncbi:MAG: leucine-rich repeat domain-containing protein, partial [Bacteroidia bacterium]